MSVEELPQPDNWRTRPLLFALGLALFVAGTIYGSAQVVMAALRGDYLSATISGGIATFALGLVLMIVLGRLRSKALRGSADTTGTTLRTDPVVTGVMAVAFAAVIPSAALYLFFAPRGDVHIPLAAPGREVVTSFYMTVLLICGLGGLVGLVIRRGRGHLRLAPEGFEFVNVLARRAGSWDDVADVTDQAANKQTNQPIVLIMKSTQPIVIKNAGGYAPSGAALYWMIRHYWKHPEDRAELSDRRALTRLRDEHFEAK